MKRIKIRGIRGGKFALVDDKDYALCKTKSWYMSTHGRPKTNHKVDGKWHQVFMHRFILDFPNGHVDHRNRNPLDNRRSNLRVCSRGENAINAPPTDGKKFKGIRLKGKKWEARIKVARKNIYLGMFVQEVDAARAYNEAAKKYFGEFAWLNKV